MQVWLWPTAGTVLAAAGTLAIKMFHRYRRSVAKDSESFADYVWGNIRLRVGRHVSSALANQLGIRRYTDARLRMFDTHLIIPSVDDARIEIDSAYVRLSLSGITSQRVADESLLTSNLGSILIFGEPGSGKSSLTKKIFRRSCASAFKAPLSNRLPVHLELRKCNWPSPGNDTDIDAGDWLYEQIFSSAAKFDGIHKPRFIVEAAASKGGLIVLLDGLDEVPEKCVPFATKAIVEATNRFHGRCTSTLVITTARTQLRPGLSRDFIGSMGAVYSLEPFSPSDIFEFLRKWPYKRDGEEHLQRNFATIQEHRTLAEMCTNPLILSMYVAQDQRYANSENLHLARLPDTRTEFYSTVIGELLVYRRSQQMGIRRAGSDTRRQREELLGKIALDHLYHSQDPANSISWPNAIAATRSVAGINSDDAAELYLQSLSVDTGIFAEERSGESLRFMHLTLCEYLAAKEVTEIESPTIPELIESAMRSTAHSHAGGRLWEVVVFAISLLKRSDRLEALTELTRQQVPPELILRVIRECRAYGSPSFEDSVKAIVGGLMAADLDSWDDLWFSKVRLLVGCFNDPAYLARASDEDPKLEMNWLLATLTESNAERLAKLFDIWLRSNPAEALSFADTLNLDSSVWANDRVIDAMEQPELRAYAISRLTDSPAHRLTWASLLAEAGLKNRLVAETLVHEAAPRNVRPVGTLQTWARTGPASKSVYGVVLSIATQRFHDSPPENHPKNLPRVELLSCLSPSQVISTAALGQTSARLARTMAVMILGVIGNAIYCTLSSWDSAGFGRMGLLGFVFATAAAPYFLGGSRLRKEGTRESKLAKETEWDRALLNIGNYRLAAVRDDIRHAMANVYGRSVAYSRYAGETPPPIITSAILRRDRVTPYPMVFGPVADLRGLRPEQLASFLLVGAFTFADATNYDELPLARPRMIIAELHRLGILILPKRNRSHVLMPTT